jgi:hypothetical protein
MKYRCLGSVFRWITSSKLLKRLRSFSGQSFVELAILLPLVLIMLAGMVEVAFAMFIYLTSLDLTREAARFASTRDYNELNVVSSCTDKSGNPTTDPIQCSCTDNLLHYFYDTACFFTDDALNPFLDVRADKFDDVVITVYTVSGNNVTDHHPASGYWSLYGDNWKKDCKGNIVRTTPFLDDTYIESRFSASAPTERGIVAVELWYCYDMILNFPFIYGFIPSPFRFHAYTIMPAPEAIPTPTPIIIPP